MPSTFISFSSLTSAWIFTTLLFIASSPLRLTAITTYSNLSLKVFPLPSVSLTYLLQTTLLFHCEVFPLLCFYGCLYNSLEHIPPELYENSSGFHLLCLFLPLFLGVLLSPVDSLCDNTSSNIWLPLHRLFFYCVQNFIWKVKPQRRAELLSSHCLILALNFTVINNAFLQVSAPYKLPPCSAAFSLLSFYFESYDNLVWKVPAEVI